MLIIKLKMNKGYIGKHKRIAIWTMKTKASYIFIMGVVICIAMQTSASIMTGFCEKQKFLSYW